MDVQKKETKETLEDAVKHSLPRRFVSKAWKIATVPGHELMQYTDSEPLLMLEIICKSFATFTGDLYVYNTIAQEQKTKRFKDWTVSGKASYIFFETFKWGVKGGITAWGYYHREQFIQLYHAISPLIPKVF